MDESIRAEKQLIVCALQPDFSYCDLQNETLHITLYHFSVPGEKEDIISAGCGKPKFSTTYTIFSVHCKVIQRGNFLLGYLLIVQTLILSLVQGQVGWIFNETPRSWKIGFALIETKWRYNASKRRNQRKALRHKSPPVGVKICWSSAVTLLNTN